MIVSVMTQLLSRQSFSRVDISRFDVNGVILRFEPLSRRDSKNKTAQKVYIFLTNEEVIATQLKQV